MQPLGPRGAMVSLELAMGIVHLGAMVLDILHMTVMKDHEDSVNHHGARPYTTIRYGIGLYGNQEEQRQLDLGGWSPQFALFDISGTRIGINSQVEEAKGNKRDRKYSSAGAMITAYVTHRTGKENLLPQYMSIMKESTDPICLQYVSIPWPNGEIWGWTGDIAKVCGYRWYPSDVVLGRSSNNAEHRPSCVWLADHKHEIKQAGMSFHLPDFYTTKAKAQQYSKYPETLCNSPPRFSMYRQLWTEHGIPVFEPPLQYKSDLRDLDRSKVTVNGTMRGGVHYNDTTRMRTGFADKHGPYHTVVLPKYWLDDKTGNVNMDSTIADTLKRSVARESRPTVNTTIVVSKRQAHSAKELCRSPTSYGPDFFSEIEGQYCDMDEKRLYPACKHPKDYDCYDPVKKNLKGGSHLQRRDGFEGVQVPAKHYSRTINWG